MNTLPFSTSCALEASRAFTLVYQPHRRQDGSSPVPRHSLQDKFRPRSSHKDPSSRSPEAGQRLSAQQRREEEKEEEKEGEEESGPLGRRPAGSSASISGSDPRFGKGPAQQRCRSNHPGRQSTEAGRETGRRSVCSGLGRGDAG